MALQKQVVPIEIATGIDTKTDPKKVTGKLIALINAVFHETKALLKRFGYQSLPQTILNGSSIGSGATLSQYQNELVELDGSSLYSYSDQQSKWVNKGALPVCTLSVNSIVKNSRGQSTQDQALHSSGFQVFTWEDTAGGSYYSVIDTGTGQTIVNSVIISATGYMAKPMAVGNYIIIIYYEQSTPSLNYVAINMSAPTTLGSPVVIDSALFNLNVPANSTTYDACVINGAVYVVASSGTGFRGYTISSTLTLTGPTTISLSGFGGNAQNVACFGDASFNVWIAYYDLANIRVMVYSQNYAAQVLAPQILEAVGGTSSAYYSTHNLTGIVTGTTGHVFYESDQQLALQQANGLVAFYGNYIRTNTCTIGGTVGTPASVIRSLGIASKPFVYNSNIYMLAVYDAERPSINTGLVYDQSTESTYFLVSSAGVIATKLAQLNGGGVTKKWIAPEAITLSASSFQVSYLFKDLLASNAGAIFTQTGINSGVISFSGVYPSKLPDGETLLLGGGLINQYDGASPTEQNFNLYPELMTSWVGGVGGALSSGSYEYQSTYEWTDNQGQTNRSSTSDALTVPVAAQQFSVSTISGSATLTMLYNNSVSAVTPGYSNLQVGYLVSGPGIPSGATITSFAYVNGPPIKYEVIISVAATATSSSSNLTATPQYGLAGTIDDLTKTMVIDKIGSFDISIYGDSVGGGYANDLSSLAVGMYISNPGQLAVPGAVGQYITAIDPVSRFVSTVLGNVITPGAFVSVITVTKQFTGTYTSGTSVVTSVSPQIFSLINVGDTVLVNGSVTFTIGSFNAGAATITSTGSFAFSGTVPAVVYFPASVLIKPGQTISGPGLSAGTYVKSVATVGTTTNIVLSQQAQTAEIEAGYTISNLYSVNLSMPTLRATNKSSVSLVLYRTQSNQTLLYRSTPVATPIINSTSEDIASLYDSIADTQIVGNEQLYTTGGEVDNSSAPASSAICTYKNRAILIPNENRLSFWYSKQVIPGSPVEFSEEFVQNIDALGGPLYACAPMDDKLILFKANNMFYMVGEGPTPAGTQNDFTEPQLIATDTGCTNPASVVLTPDGLMFQSAKGIYLLARNLQVMYIGAEVEFYNSSTVTSALLLQNVNQVRFTLSNGVALVYDYYVKQWSTFTNIAAVDSCIYNGVYSYLTAAGLVNQETTSYTDNGSFIQMSITTSWMSLAGLQGFQRIWRLLVLGTYKSPHTLQVNVAVDFAPSFEQQDNIPVTTAPTLYEYRIHMKQQKCTAIQFQIQDSQTSSFGEGFQLSEITLEAGIKVGANKLSAGVSS